LNPADGRAQPGAVADFDDVANRHAAAASELLFALVLAHRVVGQVEAFLCRAGAGQLAHLDGADGAVAVVVIGGEQLRLRAGEIGVALQVWRRG
jgi:hypothetical protein